MFNAFVFIDSSQQIWIFPSCDDIYRMNESPTIYQNFDLELKEIWQKNNIYTPRRASISNLRSYPFFRKFKFMLKIFKSLRRRRGGDSQQIVPYHNTWINDVMAVKDFNPTKTSNISVLKAQIAFSWLNHRDGFC